MTDLITHLKLCNGYSFFPHFPSIFDIYVHEYVNEIFSFRRMTSINLSYDITGSRTKCHNDSLGLKEVYFWIFTIFLSFLIFSLKFMNLQIR